MDFFKFTLKEDSISQPDADPIEHEVKIQLPLKPESFGDVMRFMAQDDLIQAGRVVIEQYLWVHGEDKEEKLKLQERILNDGRLLMSCTIAMSPIFNLCETEVKKN